MLENCCIDRNLTHTVSTILNESCVDSSKDIFLNRFKEQKITKAQLLQEFAIRNSKKWTKQDIKVKFLDGERYFKSVVKRVAQTWTQYANVHFDFVFDFQDADIRISFSQPGAWSYIGTDAASIVQTEPTMNFGGFKIGIPMKEIESTILHEFGHALGLIHEHQSPSAGIKWNKSLVYSELSRFPYNWDDEIINHNIFKKYSDDITNSIFDPESIMIYPIPARWTTNNYSVLLPYSLSATDIAFIKKVYP